MAGLSPELYRVLLKILEHCGDVAFDTDGATRTLFNDPRLRPWKGTLPGAPSYQQRISAVVNHVYDRRNVKGEGALQLMVEVMRESAHQDTECYYLLDNLAMAVALTVDRDQEQAGTIVSRLEQMLRGEDEIETAAESSMQRQLKNLQENLLLIQDRKSEFVEHTSVPLELVKAERHTEQEIARLKEQLGL